VNLSILEQISLHLIDLHSQNDTVSLLQNEYQFQLLDALANNKETLSKYKRTREEYKSISESYQQLKLDAENAKASYELDDFLYQELLKLNLKEGMQEDLEQKHSALSNVDYLQTTLAEGIRIMETEAVGLLDQLLKLRSLASGLADKAGQFTTMEQRFSNILAETEDLLSECKFQFENLESNPEELENLETKLDELNSQMQKHKVNSISDLITVQSQLEARLNRSLNMDEELNKLLTKQSKLEKSMASLAVQLTKARKGAVQILENELDDLVSRIGMNEAEFKIDLEPSTSFLSNGLDHLHFRFKSNRGSNFKPLKKIVSGGELSRIMLAVKAILSSYIKLPTLIFDEIDTGVSGKISDSIAELMVTMGQKLQVINITHLPQVAAKSHYHFKVFKQELDNKTLTNLVPLDKEARIEEIAIMLSGNQVSSTAIAHAKQLMN
jgi:DNA repair protein RecN (Recombination protein N)